MQIVFNGQERIVPVDSSIAELLDSLKLAPKQVAVEVNRELVPRARHADVRLAAGDEVEVVTLVGGG